MTQAINNYRRCAQFRGRTPASLMLALALGGCISVPNLGAPAALTDPRALASRESFAAAAAEWPQDRWWERYADPQLSALIDQGLRDSPTLAEAEARLRRAQSLADRARANEGPQLNADASAQLQKQSYNNGIPPAFVPHGYNDLGRLTLDFSWDLDFWGRNRAALATATSDARAAAADAAAARMMLAASIADAYGELARLYAAQDVAAETLRVRERSAFLVAQRQENGLESVQPLRQAQALVPSARDSLAEIDEQISLTRNRLAALIGAGPDQGFKIHQPTLQPTSRFGLPAELAANLIGRRADIVAARWRAEAATSRVRVAKTAFYPNVNLTAFIGVQALGLANLFKSGSDVGSVGPAISLPIFDAGRIRADYRGARADADTAVATYNQTLVEALHQVADAATSQRALVVRFTEARESLADNEAAYRLAELRYQGQLSSYLTVLDAEDRVLAARRTVADLEARAFTLDVALVRALGGGFSDPSSAVSTNRTTR